MGEGGIMKFGHMVSKGVYHIPENFKPKTRAQAQKDGDILYFEKECEHGHKAPRYTRDNVCKECYRLKRTKYKEAANAKDKAKELKKGLSKLRPIFTD